MDSKNIPKWYLDHFKLLVDTKCTHGSGFTKHGANGAAYRTRIGHKSNSGYWHVNYRNRQELAHAVMWTIFNGPIPDGLIVHHITQLERVRAGEKVVSKQRSAGKLHVIILTEQALFDLITEEAMKIYVPTYAQIFADAIGHVFDFKAALQDMITARCIRSREEHTRTLEHLQRA